MTGRTADAPRVLVAGVSTRAAAESAARAGFAVTALDAFGDLDQHPSVHGLSLPRDFGMAGGAGATARAGRNIACDAVVYVSNFENHPREVHTLTSDRALWGNSPAVLKCVRDPTRLMRALLRRGLAPPEVRRDFPSVDPPADPPRDPAGREMDPAPPPSDRDGRRWLVKPLASGGGHRVRPWHPGRRLPIGSYLQEFVEGTPGSVAFVSAGGRAVPLGVSRQLIGERAFGASGFQYCGSILAAAGDMQFACDTSLLSAASALALAVAEEFGVVGVNGIDFVTKDGVPHAVEVNPRWSASMELVERAYGMSMFAAHAAACSDGALPRFDLERARRGIDAVGKAVVFARQDIAVGDTRPWLADPSVRDVPHPDDHIAAGRPICTVFAVGHDSVACHAALVRRADCIYAHVAPVKN